MRQNRRRVLLVILACLLACIGVGAVVGWFFFAHMTLRVATGPMGSDGQKFFAAFVRTVADAHPRVRLKIVPTVDREASEKALIAGEADLAVVRSDMLTSSAAQTIAILRRDMVGLVIPPHTPIEKVRDLAGKTLGVVQGPAGDARILDQILASYQIPADKVQRVALAPNAISPALRDSAIRRRGESGMSSGVPCMARAIPIWLASARPRPMGCHSPGSTATNAPPGRSSRAASEKIGVSGPWKTR